MADKLGSSPRVWGQGSDMCSFAPATRIIPTRVGTRHKEKEVHNGKQDHPHACGDKDIICCTVFRLSGSSPRVWGQATHAEITIIKHRIIPTRVGTRLKKSRKIAVLQNQPLRFPLTFHRSFV